MGFEVPVDMGYRRHPKTVQLKTILSDPGADVYPIRLWLWAAEFAPTGLIKIEQRALENELGWDGKPLELVTALRKAGFLEKRRFAIHGWMERIGRAIYMYEVKKFNLRKKYAERHGIEFKDRHPSSVFYPHSSGRNTPIRDIRDTLDILDNRGEGDDASPPDPAPLPASPPAEKPDSELTQAEHRQKLITDVAAISKRVGMGAASEKQRREAAELWINAVGYKNAVTAISDRGAGQDVLKFQIKPKR